MYLYTIPAVSPLLERFLSKLMYFFLETYKISPTHGCLVLCSLSLSHIAYTNLQDLADPRLSRLVFTQSQSHRLSRPSPLRRFFIYIYTIPASSSLLERFLSKLMYFFLETYKTSPTHGCLVSCPLSLSHVVFFGLLLVRQFSMYLSTIPAVSSLSERFLHKLMYFFLET